ncbi:MAG: flagellar hook-associated protein FlgL [Pseudomonas sp.]|nr:flagellar hook-associated protein FlgL [Pseudomonas sp.]
MRISTIQAFNNGVAGIQRNYANATRTQEQISTGNRILTPADDPVASVRLLQLEQQQNVLTQYKDNLTAAKNSLSQEEVTLNSVNTVLQRVRELTVQAGNGTLDNAGRQAIAAELGERENELLSLMNTRNARGEYLFAGFQGKGQPFVRTADGTYSYQGDEGQRKLQIASSRDLPISDNGKKIFQNITNAGRISLSDTAVPPAALASGTISGMLVEDEVAFASFPPNGVQLVFDPVDPLNYTLSPVITPGVPADPTDPLSVEIPAVLGAAVNGRLQAGKDTLVHYQGAAFYVNGTPAAGASFTIAGPNGDPTSSPPNKVGILDTIASLRSTLENSATGGQVRDAVALALTNLDHGMTSVDGVRGEIGARLNVIETTQTDNEDVTLVNKSVQAGLRELDYAEALSRLAFQSIVLEASQQSYVKIAGLSLFNKI